MKLRSKVFTAFLGMVLITAAVLIAFYFFYGAESLRRLALEQIDQRFGQKIRIGEVSGALFPHLRIELGDVTLGIEEEGSSFFHASRVIVDFGLLSAFLHQLVPQKIQLEQPKLTLVRNRQGDWSFPTSRTQLDTKPTGLSSLFIIPTIHINHGVLILVDDSHPQDLNTFRMHNIRVNATKLVGTNARNFVLSGNMPNRDQKTTFSVDGTIQQGPFPSQVAQIQSKTRAPIQVSGLINITSFDLARVSQFFEIDSSALTMHGLTDIQGEFRLGPGNQGYEFDLNNFEMQSQVVAATGNVNVSGLTTTEPPRISLAVATQPVELSSLKYLLPPHILPTALQNAIARGKIGGTIQVISATITGSLRSDVRFSTVGKFRLERGRLNLGDTWGVAQNVNGLIFLKPDQIRFSDFQGLYNSIQVAPASGLIEFREAGPWLATELNGNVSVKTLFRILRKVFAHSKAAHFYRGLQGLNGGGALSIRFAGPLQQLDEFKFQDAVYQPRGTTIKFPGVATHLMDLTGTVRFSMMDVSFEPLGGMMGKSPFNLRGKLRFEETNRFEDLEIRGKFQTQDLIAQFPGYSNLARYLSGILDSRLALSGLLDKPKISGIINLENAEISAAQFFHKVSGVPGTLSFDVRFQDGKQFVFDRMDFDVLPLHLSGRGSIWTDPSLRFLAYFGLDPLVLHRLPKGVVLGRGVIPHGTLSVSFDLNGAGTDWTRWNKSGWVALTDGRLDNVGLDFPVTNIFLRMKLANHVAEVKDFEFHVQESVARFAGSIRDWETRPIVNFDMHAPQFDLELLIPKVGRSPLRIFLEHVADATEVESTLVFDRAWYKHLQFQTLTGKLVIRDNNVGINDVDGKIDEGKLNANVLVHLPINEPAVVKASTHIEGIPLSDLEKTFLDEESQKKRFITGKLSVNGHVEGHGRDPEGVIPTLNGKLDMKIVEGNVQRGTIVPKILTIMNFPVVVEGKADFNKDGYAFDFQTATIDIQDGVMKSQDIILEGPVLRMTAAGEYDMGNDQLNLITAVSPFGSYSDLLKKIPVFGLLLDGDNDAILTALFEVKGPMDEPEVTYLPLDSFQAGLTGLAMTAFNVLKNTLTLPAKILTPEEVGKESVKESDEKPDDKSQQ